MPPPNNLNMQGLVLMGMPGCGGCEMSANWLENKGVAFQKYDVRTSQEVVQWLMQVTGERTVPQFFLNGQHVKGGFPQLQALADAGQLPAPSVTQI